MKCESCGHENVEGARFCAKCGAAVPVHVIGQVDPMIGQVIGGRFHVTGVLGEGGMGIVYAGEQQMGTTVRKVAVKTLHAHLSKDSSVMARFHREVGTVAELEHPNTIKVYDFGSTKDGTLYIAMEFVSGQSLADAIAKNGAMAPERVTHIMRQVCGALDEAHLKGIIHRDLKPENIILTQRAGEIDFVKVLDFGIAARTESADAQKEQKLTQQGMVLGTPPYMSPEQFTGKQLDARSDVYSLGVMAYEMLTGKLPFDAETPWEWATQHMTVNPKAFEVAAPGRSIPDSLKQAVLRSLSKERERRQDSARQFFAELSGGARITVEAGALDQAAPGGYQPTAQMPAAPAAMAAPSPGGYAPTALQPQMNPGMMAPAPVAAHAPVTAGAVALPPAAPARKSSGGGKGLIIGLGAVGLSLVVALAVVAIRANQPDDSGPLTASTSGAGLPAVVTGETPTPEPQNNTTVADATGATTPKQTVANASGGGSKGGGAIAKNGQGGATSVTTTPATGGQTSAATTTQQAVDNAGEDKSCSQCISAAKSGSITAAAGSYQKCQDAAKKDKCQDYARKNLPKAVQYAAFNQQCDQAKALIVAAKSMGALNPTAQSILKKSSCK